MKEKILLLLKKIMMQVFHCCRLIHKHYITKFLMLKFFRIVLNDPLSLKRWKEIWCWYWIQRNG